MNSPGGNGITRREALGVVLVGSLSALLLHAPGSFLTVPTGAAATGDSLLNAGDDPAPRFRFECVTPVPEFAPLGRLEEVWANSRYTTFTDCVVTYVGDGPFVLTAEEQAVVDVVGAAGGDVSSPQQTYLLTLAASTRLDPARLAERLAQLGRPVVLGSLALAPEAPQADLFRAWLTGSP
ncbi:hypothetical protein MRBLWH7_002113 [Microbacterium sp. LWH7-1.2]|jgi:hypothetical protein|uniref:hypothetical protein n=1 Tax=Microbacterium sp. LWH7-1.2 TaxID=3135257 RepID=UPI003139790C